MSRYYLCFEDMQSVCIRKYLLFVTFVFIILFLLFEISVEKTSILHLP